MPLISEEDVTALAPLSYLRKIRGCEGEAAAMIVFSHAIREAVRMAGERAAQICDYHASRGDTPVTCAAAIREAAK